MPPVTAGRASTGYVPAPLGSVAAERLLQPPGAAGRRHLRVDDQRAIARAVQPVAHRSQIVRAAHADPGTAEPAADGGDVGRREPDGVQREPVRPEVVYL